MRTILAALALTLTLSASALAQSLMIDNAEYRLSMTLEDAIKTAKMWDQKLEWNSEKEHYDVMRAKPDKNGIVYCGSITTERGKVARVSRYHFHRDFFDAYHQFKVGAEQYSEKSGAGTIDLGDVYLAEEDGVTTNTTTSMTVTGKTWSIEFVAWQETKEEMSYVVNFEVFKKK